MSYFEILIPQIKTKTFLQTSLNTLFSNYDATEKYNITNITFI